MRVVTPLAAAASRTAAAPQPSRPAITSATSGWSVAMRANASISVGTSLRGSSVAAKATYGGRIPTAARRPRSARSVVRKRSWSTPWGATNTGAVGARTVARRARVCSLTATMAPARRVLARIIRWKNATFDRSCHSGCSKNVRSWTVTTVGVRTRSGRV